MSHLVFGAALGSVAPPWSFLSVTLRLLAQWFLSELFTNPKKSHPDSAWMVTLVGVSDATDAPAARTPITEIAAASISILTLISLPPPGPPGRCLSMGVGSRGSASLARGPREG